MEYSGDLPSCYVMLCFALSSLQIGFSGVSGEESVEEEEEENNKNEESEKAFL
jgi:hypothetical protein